MLNPNTQMKYKHTAILLIAVCFVVLLAAGLHVQNDRSALGEQVDTSDFTLYEQLASYATLRVGEAAPNINFGGASSLYDIDAEEVLMVFWASWCPHSMEEIPQLNSWAAAHPNTKVIAISLDEEQEAFERAVVQYTNLLHYTDLQKWEGKAVQDYYIYRTPTLIRLDKDKKIVRKYTSTAELMQGE